eukprot:TRINITY_DN3181_c0_g1_i1.p1 TRINITY_DN3181_c0_g1~~TRINITY_DN3181_c0_g1_i1.p1  ORF type:complete len:683 (-),score=186.37 TRINITY_DN3181_c0_g1_i1:67-1959(-)
MGTEATIKDANGKTEAHGLCILDIVKHAVKTIIKSLGDKDRLSLVQFDDRAETVFELGYMNDDGKKKAEAALEKMHQDGSTNLWAGLQLGLDNLHKNASKGRVSSVFILTDGEPNVIPPEGHIPALKNYIEKKNGLSCFINTFGFGYRLECQLLVDIAKEGNGSFNFIPDSSLTGTIFVNAMSNMLTTHATKLSLSIEPENGTVIEAVLGDHQVKEASWGRQITIGSVNASQSKDVVLRVKIPSDLNGKPYLRATLKYTQAGHENPSEIEAVGTETESKNLVAQRYRSELVQIVQGLYTSQANAGKVKEYEDLVKKIEDDKEALKDNYVADLLKDLKGQVKEAIMTQYFQKWGRFYLPSLAGAHQNQQCNNFKDPGVQHYTSKLFESIRDKTEQIFISLPPPKPTIKDTYSANAKVRTTVTSMNTYYNYGGGCFAGYCKVSMADGTVKRVDQIKKGDVVVGPLGSATVKCVVKTSCFKSMKLVQFNSGLTITPWHPVRLSGNDSWSFPDNVGTTNVDMYIDYVYDFVLSDNHSVNIDNIEVITLGHSFNNDAVARHNYFGSQRVIDDLKSCPGWNNGVVVLYSGQSARNANTNLVVSLIPTNPMIEESDNVVLPQSTTVVHLPSSVSVDC